MLIALAAAKGQQVRARGVHPVCILVVLVDEQDDREKDRKHEILQKLLQKLPVAMVLERTEGIQTARATRSWSGSRAHGFGT